MNKKRINHKLSALVLSVALATASPVQAEGLNDALGEIFNGMANVTQPGVYELQRRGVIAGGGMTVRSKVVNTQMMTFTPPSWKSSCGGIDMYLGSFSFINADQFIELLRAVAANAAGYAFEIALDNVCPQCMVVMNALQKGVQQLNQFAGNSCQLAKGIVTDGAELMGLQTRNSMGLSAMAKGLSKDWYDTFQEPDKQLDELYKENKPNEFAEKYTGNIIWQIAKKNAVATWILSGKGGDAYLEMLMSLTGTVIIEDLQNATPNDDKVMPKTTYSNILKLKHFVDGSQGMPVEIYKCEGGKTADECLTLVTKEEQVTGLKQLIIDAMVGTADSPGMIDYWSQSSLAGQEPTQIQKNIVAALPLGMGAKVRDIAIHSRETAITVVNQAAGAMATHLAIEAASQLIAAAQIAMVKADDAKRSQMKEVFEQTMKDMEHDAEVLRGTYGPMSVQLETAWKVLAMTEKSKLVMQDPVNKGNTSTK